MHQGQRVLFVFFSAHPHERSEQRLFFRYHQTVLLLDLGSAFAFAQRSLYLWPYVVQLLAWWYLGFSFFFSFSSLQGCSQARTPPLRSVPEFNFYHSCELF